MNNEQPKKDFIGDEDHSPSTGAVRKSKEDKKRKRDQRSWENVEKELVDVPEGEKFGMVREKYIDIFFELCDLKGVLRSVEKRLNISNKERDHAQAELSKAILHKTKLESLCRELQKQNKQVKEENIARIKEEEERRREVATSFTEKLNTLTSLMDENKDKSVRLREENLSMTSKLTELYDQFQEREGHLATVNRQMEIQKKLSDAQYRKLELEFQNAREIWEKERQTLLSNLDKSEHTNMILQENIKNLEEHIDVYKSQYSDFEATMHKSNKVFDAFKEELGKMNKAKAQLEKERNDYRQRWQTCTNSILQMTEMQQQTSGELKIYHKKITMLEKLCRQLQADRASYLQQLEAHKIKPITPPHLEDSKGDIHTSLPPIPKFTSAEKKQLFAKEKLIAALKTELKVMEDQLKWMNQRQEGDGDADLEKPSTSGLQRQGGDHVIIIPGDSSTDEADITLGPQVPMPKPMTLASMASSSIARSRKTRRPAREEPSDTSPECDDTQVQKSKSTKRKAKKPKNGKALTFSPNPLTLQKSSASLREATCIIIEEAVALQLPESSGSTDSYIGTPKPEEDTPTIIIEDSTGADIEESVSMAQLEVASIEEKIEEIDVSSRSETSTLRLQKPRSAPVTKKEHKDVSSGPSTTSSTEILFADLSLDAVPLYKADAITDLPKEGDKVGSLVKESEARTNLLQTVPEATTEGDEETDKADSLETIVLKESEGKTELNKDDA